MNNTPSEGDSPTSLDTHRQTRTRRHIDDLFADNHPVRVDVADLMVPIDDWRAHARSAARHLGRNVKTGVSSDQESVWARLVPIPGPPPVILVHRSGFRLFINPALVDPLGISDPLITDPGA